MGAEVGGGRVINNVYRRLADVGSNKNGGGIGTNTMCLLHFVTPYLLLYFSL